VGKVVGNTNSTNLAPCRLFIATHHHRRRHPHPLNTQLDQSSMARTKVRNIHSTHQSLLFLLPTPQQTARKSTGGPSPIMPRPSSPFPLLPFTLQARPRVSNLQPKRLGKPQLYVPHPLLACCFAHIDCDVAFTDCHWRCQEASSIPPRNCRPS